MAHAVGEVRLSIDILPRELSARRAAGHGRSEPNAYPKLNDPDAQRMQLSIRNPISSLKQVVGEAQINKLMLFAFYLAAGSICVLMVPLVGSELLYAAMRAAGSDIGMLSCEDPTVRVPIVITCHRVR